MRENMLNSGFNQAHQIQMARLQNAMSSLDIDLNDGKIDPFVHQQMSQQVGMQLQRLTAMQQQAQEAAEQQQMQQAMKQMAMQQAVMHQNSVSDAQSFPQRIAWVADPGTGKIAGLYPESPGTWKQLQFPEDNVPTQSMGEE